MFLKNNRNVKNDINQITSKINELRKNIRNVDELKSEILKNEKSIKNFQECLERIKNQFLQRKELIHKSVELLDWKSFYLNQ